MKISKEWMKRNAGGILRESLEERRKWEGKKEGMSRGEQGKEGMWLGVLGCLMDEGVERLVGAVSPE